MLAFPEWLGLEIEKLLASLNILELDEDRALEQFHIGATKANRVNWSVWGEESFDVELRAGLFISETLGVDRSSLRWGPFDVRVVCKFALDFFETFWASNFEELTFSESCNNSTDGLEALHAAKGGADLLNFDRQVVGAIS